jgi:hypothetical protein
MAIEKLGSSIKEVASSTGQSEWLVKHKLRKGRYRAKKEGRRTIIINESVREDFENLPDATFAPPRRRRSSALTT